MFFAQPRRVNMTPSSFKLIYTYKLKNKKSKIVLSLALD